MRKKIFVFGFGFGRAEPGTHRKRTVAIRLELMEQGYIRKTKGKKIQPQQHSEPLRFTTTDGSVVLVGRNTGKTTSSP